MGSTPFVLDCSLTMAWCFREETAIESLKLLRQLDSEPALVPDFWYIEVTNVLANAIKKGRLSTTGLSDFLSMLSYLNLEIDYEASERAFSHLLPLCRNSGLTSYDAVYLDLAIRRGLPLASLDVEIRACAQQHGVEVLGL